MVCKKCGMNLADEMQFCHYCGAQVGGVYINHSIQIIGRSQTYKNELEAWRKKAYLAVVSQEFAIGIACCIMALASMLIEDLREITWLPFVLGVCGGVSFLFLNKKGQNFNDSIRSNFEACEKEELILDDVKIYGKNSSGDVQLMYSQIVSVRCQPNRICPKGVQIPFEYNRLSIQDSIGRTWGFNSFSNANELYAIINSKIFNGTYNQEQTRSTPVIEENETAPSNIPLEDTTIKEEKKIIPEAYKMCMGCGEIVSDTLERCTCGCRSFWYPNE